MRSFLLAAMVLPMVAPVACKSDKKSSSEVKQAVINNSDAQPATGAGTMAATVIFATDGLQCHEQIEARWGEESEAPPAYESTATSLEAAVDEVVALSGAEFPSTLVAQFKADVASAKLKTAVVDYWKWDSMQEAENAANLIIAERRCSFAFIVVASSATSSSAISSPERGMNSESTGDESREIVTFGNDCQDGYYDTRLGGEALCILIPYFGGTASTTGTINASSECLEKIKGKLEETLAFVRLTAQGRTVNLIFASKENVAGSKVEMLNRAAVDVGCSVQ